MDCSSFQARRAKRAKKTTKTLGVRPPDPPRTRSSRSWAKWSLRPPPVVNLTKVLLRPWWPHLLLRRITVSPRRIRRRQSRTGTTPGLRSARLCSLDGIPSYSRSSRVTGFIDFVIKSLKLVTLRSFLCPNFELAARMIRIRCGKGTRNPVILLNLSSPLLPTYLWIIS